MPFPDGLLIRSAHPAGRLSRSISASLRFIKARQRRRLELTPSQATFHRPAHHSIHRVLREAGQAGRSPHRAALLEQGGDLRFEGRSEPPARGRPRHAGLQGAPVFNQQARNPGRNDSFKLARIQMPPRPLLPVFDFRPLVGFGFSLNLPARAPNADAHLPRFPVDHYVHHLPRRHQFQRLRLKFLQAECLHLESLFRISKSQSPRSSPLRLLAWQKRRNPAISATTLNLLLVTAWNQGSCLFLWRPQTRPKPAAKKCLGKAAGEGMLQCCPNSL